jgi:EmrB/QacA subfamily drug resistance transporter
LLSPEILGPAVVVVLGAVMTILDATIVNVALPVLGRDLHTSISAIQWVPTVYLLAFASVIPLTGCASGRFGARTVWLASLAAFMTGSLLAGLSWSIGSLITFRLLQGLGGGMIMPLGQMMLAQAAGPRRIGQVMSIIGVPLLLAPVFGPLIGGSLIGAASWRWIFLVNLPVGAAAFAAAMRLLPPAARTGRRTRLDAAGLVLLSGGLSAALYGLAEMGQAGRLAGSGTLGPLVGGAGLVAAFVAHALRSPIPLIDVRLFTRRGFAAAANLMLGMALFGGRTALGTGLFLAPQGVGAAAIPLAGHLTDKVGARRVVVTGVLLALAGIAAYTQIGARSSYWYLACALLVIGMGLGATITPSMAAAFHGLAPAEMAAATSAINVVQRVAGSIGSALLAVVLQAEMTARLPASTGPSARPPQQRRGPPGMCPPRSPAPSPIPSSWPSP